ncbi:MAG TPA: hypothetical protein VNZ58_06815 [Thermomicrobiales bacterium]|nr:hypothetical protein [Thermomicrobiales bacterium]
MRPIRPQRPPAPPELQSEWDRLLAVMPETVRMAVTSELWNLEWLHELVLPVRDIAIGEVAWLFDVPLWAVGGEPFRVTPNEVRTRPRRFMEQFERTMASDLAWPIHIMRFRGRWIVLDGVHRLLKADMTGKRTVRAMALSEDDYANILFPPSG